MSQPWNSDAFTNSIIQQLHSENKNPFQSNANHPLADSVGYIKLEGT